MDDPYRFRGTCLLFLSLLAGCGGPSQLAQELCDGSDDIRLSFGWGFDGGNNTAVEYVMLAEGMKYLKVDGNCHYYVYNSDLLPGLWWEPVREGDFSDDELDEVIEGLGVDQWASFESPVEQVAHDSEWNLFQVLDSAVTCPVLCVDDRGLGAANAAKAYIPRLASRSAPVVPQTLEVVVLSSAGAGLPLVVDWAASRPMSDFLYEGYDAYLSRDPDDIGTFVTAADEPWFLAIRAEYRAIGVNGGAIGISTGSGEPTHSLYIRTVVPAIEAI